MNLHGADVPKLALKERTLESTINTHIRHRKASVHTSSMNSNKGLKTNSKKSMDFSRWNACIIGAKNTSRGKSVCSLLLEESPSFIPTFRKYLPSSVILKNVGPNLSRTEPRTLVFSTRFTAHFLFRIWRPIIFTILIFGPLLGFTVDSGFPCKYCPITCHLNFEFKFTLKFKL